MISRNEIGIVNNEKYCYIQAKRFRPKPEYKINKYTSIYNNITYFITTKRFEYRKRNDLLIYLRKNGF